MSIFERFFFEIGMEVPSWNPLFFQFLVRTMYRTRKFRTKNPFHEPKFVLVRIFGTVRSSRLVPLCPIDHLKGQSKTLITAPKEKLQILLRTWRFRLFVIFWIPNYLLRCHFLNDKWKQIQIRFMVFYLKGLICIKIQVFDSFSWFIANQ